MNEGQEFFLLDMERHPSYAQVLFIADQGWWEALITQADGRTVYDVEPNY